MANIRRPTTANTAINIEQVKLLFIDGGSVKWQNHFGTLYKISNKVKHIYIIEHQNFIPKYLFKRNKNM